jgi:hypothetical protein
MGPNLKLVHAENVNFIQVRFCGSINLCRSLTVAEVHVDFKGRGCRQDINGEGMATHFETLACPDSEEDILKANKCEHSLEILF